MSLTQTASVAKKSIIGFFIFTFIFLSSYIGFRIWQSYKIAHTPPVEEKPNLKFGTLPQPQFHKLKSSISSFSYSLDTVTGGLPTFDKLIKVYFIPKAQTTLLAADRSRALADKFGIQATPNIISQTRYSFSDGGKTLTVDLDTGNFNYTAPASSARLSSDQKKLVTDFKTLLSSLGVSKKELSNGPSKVSIINSENQAAQISIWPESIDDKTILTANANKSLVTGVVVGPATELASYRSLNFTFWTVDTTTFATYPLKSAPLAFEDLKVGKGVVVVDPGKPQISITAVSLAYFEEDSYTSYLQPIYVFEGPGFVAYVPAITDANLSPTK